MLKQRVIILMGSKSDLDFAISVGRALEGFDVDYEYRIASAHKTPRELLTILEEYEQSGDKIVYITIAGMSNALSGFVDANTRYPVIACPPSSEKLDVDIYSSLRMPSGVAPVVILNPENAALVAAKILGLENPSISERISRFQLEKRKEVSNADNEVKRKRASDLERQTTG